LLTAFLIARNVKALTNLQNETNLKCTIIITYLKYKNKNTMAIITAILAITDRMIIRAS
jgi:hypothetical protein